MLFGKLESLLGCSKVADVAAIRSIRLLLKAGCAPCLAGCRWYGICTKWVENLLFEVNLMAFSSVFRPET